jgi:tRNA1Val (adenine37-N6)-methyltransferase
VANDYFQFKQFLIKQDRCAMKVCTDSCVLGAYARVSGAQHILDIGAGTGLLSLMVAQRAPEAVIDAVEIDPDAAAQAEENISQSPWADRVRLFPVSLQQFAKTSPEPYDVILSNPPFFQASLKSPDAAKNKAKHTEALSFTEITAFAAQYLAPTGKLHILLPPHEARVFEREAQAAGFQTEKILWLEATPGGKLLRGIFTYSREAAVVTEQTLAVREKDHQYTSAFQNLLRAYYLIF